ncbi:MAG: exodeoxyribonuclease V subunit alpha [Desulforhabdus sp.]|nr:exodeoxyribonuclease V subunit alpha [Desulforhabdus sp.]
MTKENLYRLVDCGILSFLDVHFAGFMEELNAHRSPELLLAAALVSAGSRQGHICLDLAALAGKPLSEDEEGAEALLCPELHRWSGVLNKCSVVGTAGDYRPLIFDNRSRLYLYRYWHYQEQLAGSIRKRVEEANQMTDLDRMKQGLDRLFPVPGEAGIDWQKVAAFAAGSGKFTVISGGPGTGKTTTVAKILALLVELAGSGTHRIALAAPTGKAAARLQEAIKKAKEIINCTDEVREAIPEQASTIHRLLGAIPKSPYFRHNEKNLLPVDVLVIDEASMVDLALMSKLVRALPDKARLILLGDKDQLASVEAGAVLGDICDTGRMHGYSDDFLEALHEVTGFAPGGAPQGQGAGGIGDCIVQLQKSYRFGADSGIGILSRAVNEGDAPLALAILQGGVHKSVEWKRLPSAKALPASIGAGVVKGFREYLKRPDLPEVFELFDRFRILCAVREGPFGVVAFNRLVERILTAHRLIDPKKTWYAGRPVLIKVNDYSLRLFNGDVGIALPDREAANDLRVFFPGSDGAVRKFHPLRLPDHETVFAMTVHKSQGSEFSEVLLILPDKEVAVLTRELVYTAITRARERIEIWGKEDIFSIALSRRIKRLSGLRDALWDT